MTSNKRAVVAGHADYAAGMVSAVAQIAGLGDMFVPVSNTGLGPEAIEAALREQLQASGARVIFTDLPAGSATLAARRVARTDAGLTVVTGASLPALLSWACGCELPVAVAKGKESIVLLEGAGGP